MNSKSDQEKPDVIIGISWPGSALLTIAMLNLAARGGGMVMVTTDEAGIDTGELLTVRSIGADELFEGPAWPEAIDKLQVMLVEEVPAPVYELKAFDMPDLRHFIVERPPLHPYGPKQRRGKGKARKY